MKGEEEVLDELVTDISADDDEYVYVKVRKKDLPADATDTCVLVPKETIAKYDAKQDEMTKELERGNENMEKMSRMLESVLKRVKVMNALPRTQPPATDTGRHANVRAKMKRKETENDVSDDSSNAQCSSNTRSSRHDVQLVHHDGRSELRRSDGSDKTNDGLSTQSEIDVVKVDNAVQSPTAPNAHHAANDEDSSESITRKKKRKYIKRKSKSSSTKRKNDSALTPPKNDSKKKPPSQQSAPAQTAQQSPPAQQPPQSQSLFTPPLTANQLRKVTQTDSGTLISWDLPDGQAHLPLDAAFCEQKKKEAIDQVSPGTTDMKELCEDVNNPSSAYREGLLTLAMSVYYHLVEGLDDDKPVKIKGKLNTNFAGNTLDKYLRSLPEPAKTALMVATNMMEVPGITEDTIGEITAQIAAELKPSFGWDESESMN